ncbi:MAG: hypothetical protein H6Q33_2300 [Deltaproteobacteria bacterium]|nr:hypothetical protein [Deltaproteobacteria bacterium]
MTKVEDEAFEVSRAVMRVHAGVLALVGGVLGGVAVFVATAWLLIKGGPSVGAHLQLLDQFFYGYSVSWSGSVIGALYGACLGALVGGLTGAIYNLVVGLRE